MDIDPEAGIGGVGAASAPRLGRGLVPNHPLDFMPADGVPRQRALP